MLSQANQGKSREVTFSLSHVLCQVLHPSSIGFWLSLLGKLVLLALPVLTSPALATPWFWCQCQLSTSSVTLHVWRIIERGDVGLLLALPFWAQMSIGQQ